MTEEKKTGRPEHAPTKATRDTVVLHARVGTPQDLIAQVLQICKKTLLKHYREELDTSVAVANAEVGGVLFNKALKGDTLAATFWLKTRAGFRESRDVDITSNGETLKPTFIFNPVDSDD